MSEQLNGYEFLKELHIGFRFYNGRYLDAIGDARDSTLKTIVHIPHGGAAEAGVDKMFAVDAIISSLGQPLGSRSIANRIVLFDVGLLLRRIDQRWC